MREGELSLNAGVCAIAEETREAYKDIVVEDGGITKKVAKRILSAIIRGKDTITQIKSNVLVVATMAKSGLSKSTRKFIRREKARIRGGILNMEEQKEQIAKLYERYFPSAIMIPHAAKSHTVESVAGKSAVAKGEKSALVKRQTKKVTSEKGDKAKAKKPEM